MQNIPGDIIFTDTSQNIISIDSDVLYHDDSDEVSVPASPLFKEVHRSLEYDDNDPRGE